MSDEELTITIPAALARELDSTSQEFLAEVLERYAQGGVSLSAAARQAGVSQSELARHAYARGSSTPGTSGTTRRSFAWPSACRRRRWRRMWGC